MNTIYPNYNLITGIDNKKIFDNRNIKLSASDYKTCYLPNLPGIISIDSRNILIKT